ncbi:MAG TPA: YncE family protein [Acidimicrobiia bacterium]
MGRLSAVVMMSAAACTPAASEPPATTMAEPIAASTSSSSSTTSTSAATTTIPATTTTTLVAADGLTAADRVLVEVGTIAGGLAAKSVVASGSGLFFAQNMMYRHTITVYDRDYRLLKTIPDEVTPAEYGHGDDFPGTYRGSPVEAAFTSDGAYAYVSNYRMYGGGLSTVAGDGCDQGDWPDSFVYRVDTSTLRIDRLLRVGPVPKFLTVTPDDSFVLVSNWCGFDVSVLDVATGVEVARVPVGRHPRGIAVTPGSTLAYVAVMGSADIAVIDLRTLDVVYMEGVGRGPRHLVMSPDGSILYVSLNNEGRLAKVDLATGQVLVKVATGSAPRSMTISDDGTALYVVNYGSDTMSKVRTADMVEIEEIRVNDKPIGITYDAATRQVWVSAYSGTIEIFADVAP